MARTPKETKGKSVKKETKPAPAKKFYRVNTRVTKQLILPGRGILVGEQAVPEGVSKEMIQDLVDRRVIYLNGTEPPPPFKKVGKRRRRRQDDLVDEEFLERREQLIDATNNDDEDDDEDEDDDDDDDDEDEDDDDEDEIEDKGTVEVEIEEIVEDEPESQLPPPDRPKRNPARRGGRKAARIGR